MSCTTGDISISPVNVYWQHEHVDVFDFASATATGVGGKYVTLYLPNGDGFYAWFDENNTDTDPAPGGLTDIEVDFAAAATPQAIATSFQSAVNAVTGFTATVSGTQVTVTRDAVGAVTPSALGPSMTGLVTITVCTNGKDLDLGLLQGDVELSVAPANFIVQAHQSGLTPRAALFQGLETLEVTTTLLETGSSKLEAIYGVYGGSFTPSMGTKVFGIGTSKQGQNLLIDGGRLVLRPVNAVDQTTDTNLMMAIPVPDSLVFSGENPKTLSITWQGFIADGKDSRVSGLLFGDATQTGI